MRELPESQVLSGSDWKFCEPCLKKKQKKQLLPNSALLSSLQWRSKAKAASSPALASAPASLFTPVAPTPAAPAFTPAKMAPC